MKRAITLMLVLLFLLGSRVISQATAPEHSVNVYTGLGLTSPRWWKPGYTIGLALSAKSPDSHKGIVYSFDFVHFQELEKTHIYGAKSVRLWPISDVAVPTWGNTLNIIFLAGSIKITPWQVMSGVGPYFIAGAGPMFRAGFDREDTRSYWYHYGPSLGLGMRGGGGLEFAAGTLSVVFFDLQLNAMLPYDPDAFYVHLRTGVTVPY